jgi:hypothetical protein
VEKTSEIPIHSILLTKRRERRAADEVKSLSFNTYFQYEEWYAWGKKRTEAVAGYKATTTTTGAGAHCARHPSPLHSLQQPAHSATGNKYKSALRVDIGLF